MGWLIARPYKAVRGGRTSVFACQDQKIKFKNRYELGAKSSKIIKKNHIYL
jgi:hypothetical protein